MKSNREILIAYVLFSFFNSSASSVPLEVRVQHYINFASQGVSVQSGKSSRSERAIALIKIALGRMDGPLFLPDEEAVLYLIRNEYLNPRIKDRYTGATLLHFAAFYGAYDLVRYLLHEAHVCIGVDHEGKTPLHWAANPYHKIPCKKVIKLLVEVRKDLIHARDFSHKTPLFYMSDYSEAADFLLGKGININAQDDRGRTAIFTFKNEESTKYLCSHGADVNQPDYNRLTALGAYLTDYSSFYDLAKKNPSLFFEKVKELEKGIKLLVQYGCYVPRMYHPAYKMEPLEFENLQKEKMNRMVGLLPAFGVTLQNMEEYLRWVKVRLDLSRRSTTLQGVSPVLVFDQYVSVLPFFEARYNEMNEIFQKEKELGIRSEEESSDSDTEFGEFLSRLSFSKQISSELHLMACDLIRNKEEYVAARALPDSERGEVGKKIIEKIFS